MAVTFIIDSSESIRKPNYQRQKNIVKAMARSFGIAGQSQGAIVLFSNSASVKARFGQHSSLDEFQRAVDQLPQERGQTRIDKALALASSDIFPEARPGVAKIALLITDGRQTVADDAKDLKEASEPLRQTGVRVIALGIGSGVDGAELRSITESDDEVVLAKDFDDMVLRLRNLTRKACHLAGEYSKQNHFGKKCSML